MATKQILCTEYIGRFAVSFNEKSIKKALAFKPQKSDILIVTLLKSGTTLTQMIVHGLRSNGDLSFEDIDLTVPFMEVAHDINLDLNEDVSEWFPRAYKTHINIKCIPNGVKCICVIRDPFDIILSWYYFVYDYVLDARCTIDDFVKYVVLTLSDADVPIPSIWNGLLSLYERRLDPDCLLLHYEDLIEDRMSCIKLIADFMNLESDQDKKVSDDLLDTVFKQSSLDFMKKWKFKFDMHTIKKHINKMLNLDENAGINTNSTVRTGKSGLGKKAMNGESIKLIDGLWKKHIKSNLGFNSYDEMRKSINMDLGRNFK